MTEMRVRTIRYALIWLLLVGATASVSWAAIARAGAQASLLGAPPPLAATSSTGAPAVIRPTQSETEPLPTQSDTAPLPTQPSTAPPTSAPRTSTSGRVTRPSTSSTHAASSPPPVQSAVKPFSTAGGQLWAYCEGGIPKARVVPAEGWGFHVSEDDARLEVTFEPPDGHGDHIEVKVRCIAGLPSFSTD